MQLMTLLQCLPQLSLLVKALPLEGADTFCPHLLGELMRAEGQSVFARRPE